MPINRNQSIYKALVFLIVIILPLYSVFVMAPLFSDLIVGNLGDNARKSAKHISRMVLDDNYFAVGKELSPEFKEAANKTLADFDILKIKVFSIDGTTIFSTSEEDIGKTYPDAAFWAEISSGTSYSKIVKNKSYSVDNELFQSDVIETYSPLLAGNKMVGAIEIYTSIERQQKALTSLSLRHHLMVLAILVLMGITYVLAGEKEKSHRRVQQKFQDQLLHAKTEWEKTFDAIEDVIAIIDLSFTVKRINKAGRERFNASFSELVGRKCFEVLDQSAEICSNCPIPMVLEDGKTHHAEMFNSNTGQTYWVSVAPFFDEFGHVNGFVHISRDISHQKMMEQQMQRSQRRESLAVLTKGVAHNFRNILASILMNSQVLQGNYSEDPQINEITGWINESVQAGSKLVTGLMQFSPQNIKKEFQKIDLARFIPDAYDLVRTSVEKNVNLSYEVAKSLEIMGDTGALFQVLANICSNAADAMPGGGDLRIKLTGVETDALIEISDTGCGIEGIILDKIFEPFFTTKEVDKGTGLGLSSSYGIIKDHGGEIKVDSVVGVGTTFTITLPLTENGITENKLTSLNDIEGLGQRILLVDDEKQALVPMTRLLERAGYHTASAANCEEALAELNAWRPDLVIIDYNMPIKNGIDCATEINLLDPAVKIIILSGSNIEDIYELIQERGIEFISCCLEKPIGIVELNRAVTDIFGGEEENGG